MKRVIRIAGTAAAAIAMTAVAAFVAPVIYAYRANRRSA